MQNDKLAWKNDGYAITIRQMIQCFNPLPNLIDRILDLSKLKALADVAKNRAIFL